ncbi:hypothetical protein D9611_006953 [Ephemerocybe angulata]|uniref:ATP-citrate synthase citrate-binding domain-containing protein n=1 Tax=Ephemerocybe angulata TaxID=980116 RepID=A0A8H5AZT4_9AGAR|nr:hypothetical protein D9611_006953 [Tulosesus angulatus]
MDSKLQAQSASSTTSKSDATTHFVRTSPAVHDDLVDMAAPRRSQDELAGTAAWGTMKESLPQENAFEKVRRVVRQHAPGSVVGRRITTQGGAGLQGLSVVSKTSKARPLLTSPGLPITFSISILQQRPSPPATPSPQPPSPTSLQRRRTFSSTSSSACPTSMAISTLPTSRVVDGGKPQVYYLDIAAKQTAAKFTADRGLPWRKPTSRSSTPRASLKLTVLNAEGRIWTMMAGGGASVVYSDAIAAHSFAHELANYGEYILRGRHTSKILIIGGGIANFTNVAATFNVIRALKEYKDQAVYEASPALGYHEMVLMFFADHGPAISGAMNMIVATRAGKSSLALGFFTIGSRFGGALDEAATIFSNVRDMGLTPREFVDQARKQNKPISGIDHKIKSVNNPDLRRKEKERKRNSFSIAIGSQSDEE